MGAHPVEDRSDGVDVDGRHVAVVDGDCCEVDGGQVDDVESGDVDVWHFWTGSERTFACWYINLQASFVRTEIGYDTQDFELDVVVSPDGSFVVKDLEVLDDRVAEGRFSSELVGWVRELGEHVVGELQARRHWWDPSWANWVPPSDWCDARLASGWSTEPTRLPLLDGDTAR